jgi:hypothetical protein
MNLAVSHIRQFAVASAVAFLFSGPLSANGLALGLSGGTLGAGAEVSFGSPTLQGRALLATWTNSIDVNTNDVSYSGDLQLDHLALLVDWFPTGRGFRLTGGVVFNDDRVDATAPLSQLLDPSDIPPGIPPSLIDSVGRLEGSATFDSAAPYLGIGFGNSLGTSGRWRFKADLGVMFLGEPQVDLVAAINPAITVPPEVQLILDALVAEEEAYLQSEVNDYDLYPVVQLGVTYRF